jgi:hypothetical protein
LCKNEDPDAWIKTLEELSHKIDTGSVMIDDQLMIHMLNNLAGDNKLQIVLLEKRNGNKENLLEVDELHEQSNLIFEIL